jgi:hypothetical protein
MKRREEVVGVVVRFEMEGRIGHDVLVAHLHRVGYDRDREDRELRMWVEEGTSYRGATAAASNVKEALFMARAMETVMQNKTFVAAIKLDLFGVKTPPVVVECKRCRLPRTEGEEHDCVYALLLEVGRLREAAGAKVGAT